MSCEICLESRAAASSGPTISPAACIAETSVTSKPRCAFPADSLMMVADSGLTGGARDKPPACRAIGLLPQHSSSFQCCRKSRLSRVLAPSATAEDHAPTAQIYRRQRTAGRSPSACGLHWGSIFSANQYVCAACCSRRRNLCGRSNLCRTGDYPDHRRIRTNSRSSTRHHGWCVWHCFRSRRSDRLVSRRLHALHPLASYVQRLH